MPQALRPRDPARAARPRARVLGARELVRALGAREPERGRLPRTREAAPLLERAARSREPVRALAPVREPVRALERRFAWSFAPDRVEARPGWVRVAAASPVPPGRAGPAPGGPLPPLEPRRGMPKATSILKTRRKPETYTATFSRIPPILRGRSPDGGRLLSRCSRNLCVRPACVASCG